MNKLLALTLLASLVGCNASSNTSEVRADSNSSREVSDQLSSPYGYDLPLVINAKTFAETARSELTKVFGPLPNDGIIVYQDSYIIGGFPIFNDHTRLHYLTKVNSVLTEGSDVYAAYVVTTSGEQITAFAKYSKAAGQITLSFPGYIIGTHPEANQADVEALYADLQAKYPSLSVKQFCGIVNGMGVVSAATPGMVPKTDGKCGDPILDQSGQPVFVEGLVEAKSLSAEHVRDLSNFLEAINSDPRVRYVEPNSEIRNPGETAPTIELGNGKDSKYIDVNGLRTVTINALKTEPKLIPVTLPSLPEPFGKGVVKNPAANVGFANP